MKKQTLNTRIIAVLLTGQILFASCSSTTIIQSNPSNAKLCINGESVGTTPYTYQDTKILGSKNMVKLEKEGYEPFITSFSRDEEVDVGAIVGGCFFTIPFLWTLKYKPVHSYDLIPSSGNEQQMSGTNIQQDQFDSKTKKLRELKRLLDDKVITPEEFTKEKMKVLTEEEE